MKIFLSWSGERSKAIAKTLRDWLRVLSPDFRPWMSDVEIKAGDRWFHALHSELSKSEAGILCLTPESIVSPWLIYETGALAMSVLETDRLIPVLFGVSIRDLPEPLRHSNAVVLDSNVERKEMRHLVETLMAHDRISENLAEIDTRFNALWPGLKEGLATVRGMHIQNDPIDGIWVDTYISEEGDRVHVAIVHIESRLGKIEVSGAEFDDNLREILSWQSVAVGRQNNHLDYVYRSKLHLIPGSNFKGMTELAFNDLKWNGSSSVYHGYQGYFINIRMRDNGIMPESGMLVGHRISADELATYSQNNMTFVQRYLHTSNYVNKQEYD